VIDFNLLVHRLIPYLISFEDNTNLGINILAGRAFRCELHRAKIKFVRSLNGILGNVGTASPANLTRSLINTFCTPSLLFGLEALLLTKSQTTSLSYPYNSAYMKLFFTFDKEVVKQCKFLLVIYLSRE